MILEPLLGVNWNVDTDSLIVCRRTGQEVPPKITQRIVLSCVSFVSAVFDPLGICLSFAIRVRFLLKSIWASMGHASDKVVNRALKDSDWRSELKEMRTMSIIRLHFENRCTHFETRQTKQCATSARYSDVETNLCDMKLPCRTYQLHVNSEVRTSSRSSPDSKLHCLFNDEMDQAEQILFRFVQTEGFPNVSMLIANSKISKTEHCQIVTLLRRGWNNSSERSAEAFASRLQNIQSYYLYWRERNVSVCTKADFSSTRVLDHWVENCFKETQVKFCQISAQKRQFNPSTDCRLTTRAT